MKLFLGVTLAICLGLVVQVPTTEAGFLGGLLNTGANIAGGLINTGANIAGGILHGGANMINAGITTAGNIITGATSAFWGPGHTVINWQVGPTGFDFGSLLSHFGISGNLGGTTVINWKSLLAQGPNAQGYFDLGAFLAQNGYSGIGPGQLLIQWSALQNVRPDIFGNITIKTMLAQIFGSGTTAIEWNPSPLPAQHIVIQWDMIRNARPDQYGNVDLAALLAPLGFNLGGGGHYVISWNTLQGLKPDASGNIDISFLLQQIANGGGSQTITYEVNWPDLMQHLGFGSNAPSTITINIQAMKQMQPMADGTVDIGSMLQQLGISKGPFIVSYDTIKNLPTNAAGEIDLMTLLQMLKINIANGPSNTNTNTVPTPAPAAFDVNLDAIHQFLGIPKGNTIFLGIDTLRNLRPDSNGNVNAGPYLKNFGIGDGSYIISYDVIRNLPSDASGKIDLLTLLEYFKIPFHYGGSAPNTTSETFTVNIDDIYQKMGFSKGNTVTISIDTLKNLRPDSYGHVDAGKFLQSLGIDIGSYIINYDLVKNLPSGPDGKIELFTLLQGLNIGFNSGTPNNPTTPIAPTNEKLMVDLSYIFNKLGFTKDTIVSIMGMKTLKPDAMGYVNIGPYLQAWDIGNGSFFVNYQTVQNLPCDSEGKINFLTLLQRLNIPFNYGPSTLIAYLASLDNLYKKFGVEKGNPITISYDSLKNLIPDSFGNVQLGPLLEPLGIGDGHYLAPYEVIKNLPIDSQGKFDLLTLLKNIGIDCVYGNGSPSQEPVYISFADIYNKLGVEPGSPINININELKNLKPDSHGNVDIGSFLQKIGIGNGSHVINFDIIKNLPTDPSGNVDIFSLLPSFNINLTGEKPQKPTVTIDIQDILKQLAVLNGNNGGQTITIDFNTIQHLLPNGNNEVDLSPYLQSLGFHMQGPLYVNYDIIKTMPTQPNGGIDLFGLIGKLSHTQEPTVIGLENLYELLYPQVHQPGSTTITFNIQGFIPNERNQVNIAPLLATLGFGNFAPIYINFDTLKQLVQGPSGDVDLFTLLATLTGHPVENNTTPTTTTQWTIDDLLNKIPQTTGGHTITINVNSLRPNSQNQVDIGPLMTQWGFNIGSFPIDYNIISGLPKDPNGGIDLFALLNFIKGNTNVPTPAPVDVNLDTIYHFLGIPKGNTISIGIDTLKNLRPDSNGYVNAGPYLKNFGIGDGSYLVSYDIIRNLPSDASGKIDLCTLLEYFHIPFHYGGSAPNTTSEPITVNIDDIYQKLGFTKGSSVSVSIQTLKNLRPDSYGHVDAGKFLQSLGINIGSYIIDYDLVKNLPSDPNGMIDIFTLLEKLKLIYQVEKPQIPTINIQDILKQLAVINSNHGGQTITIDFNTIQHLLPNGNNEVDLSPYLQSLGFQIQGPLYVNYDIIKTLPTQPNGGIDLFTLIGKLSHSQEPTVVSLENLYELLYPQVHQPGSTTITFNIQGLTPNEKNQVNISPLLAQLGFGNFAPIYINFDTLKQLVQGPSGEINLFTLLAFMTGHPIENTTTPTTVQWTIDDLLSKITQTTGSHTITINVNSLRPNSQNQVDIGPLMSQWGFNVGSFLIDYNVINSLPKDSNGGFDLFALLNFIKSQQHNTITTINIQSLKQMQPMADGTVDIGPMLQQWGISKGSFFVSYNIIKNLPTNALGQIELTTFLRLINFNSNTSAPSATPSDVNLDTIYQLLGIPKGNTIFIGIDALKNLRPDSNGNVNVGPYLKNFGIVDGSFLVSYDVIKNLPSDASGKIDLFTLLECFHIPFHYGGSAPNAISAPITVNINDIYQKLGFSKGSTVSIGIDTLKNLRPDSYGHVDAGKFLQFLGIGSGSHIINYDVVKNLSSGSDGKMELFTLLDKLNVRVI